MELEFADYKNDMVFDSEHQLSKKPIRMDLLIIRKTSNVKIKTDIGQIFRNYNICEYKSPGDALTIDTFYKTISYAAHYKSLGKTVDEIPAEELTISIFREAKPKKLFENLKKLDAGIQEAFPGVYYVTGITHIPTQIVVLSEVGKEHSALRILSKQVKAEDVKNFLRKTNALTDPGDRQNIDAVMEVSLAANRRLFDEMREEMGMNAVLEDFFKDKLDEREQRGELKGEQRGELNATKLINFLWKNGRGEEAERAENDKDFLAQLMTEFKAQNEENM